LKKPSLNFLKQSIATTLKQCKNPQEVWVFGYASLIWFPNFFYTQSHPAVLKGYQRTLCIQAKVYRGTPRFPGLVFGLEEGDFCQGKAFLLSPEKQEESLLKLWEREMVDDAYTPAWVEVSTPDEAKISAITFLANQQGSCYIKQPDFSELKKILLKAQGTTGTCYDYVYQTYLAFQEHQIEDQNLEKIFQYLEHN